MTGLNAWIPVASALVSACAVLFASILANRQAHRMKILELETEARGRSQGKRLEVGEDLYRKLQLLAKFNSNGSNIALEILDGKMKFDDRIKKISEISNEIAKLDTILMRFQLETYFPDIHRNEWSKFEKQLRDFIDLTELLKQNIKPLKSREAGETVEVGGCEQYRALPDKARGTMHALCKQISDELTYAID